MCYVWQSQGTGETQTWYAGLPRRVWGMTASAGGVGAAPHSALQKTGLGFRAGLCGQRPRQAQWLPEWPLESYELGFEPQHFIAGGVTLSQ